MFFFFKQKTAYEIGVRLVGSEMCIRDSIWCEGNKLRLWNAVPNSLKKIECVHGFKKAFIDFYACSILLFFVVFLLFDNFLVTTFNCSFYCCIFNCNFYGLFYIYFQLWLLTFHNEGRRFVSLMFCVTLFK